MLKVDISLSIYCTVSARSQLQAEIDENKPRFIKQLKNVTVTEEETATFDCVVVGQPEPEVILYTCNGSDYHSFAQNTQFT